MLLGKDPKSQRVIVFGAGHIGSRALQGFTNVNAALDIIVVDPSTKNLKEAETLWKNTGGYNSLHTIQWINTISPKIESADVVLVSTSSKERACLIDELVNTIHVRYWVLEKVLAQSQNQLDIIRTAISGSEGAWINTSRRMMTWHKALKDAFVSHGPLQVSYTGGIWGLACNSIHFIDLVAWWSGESLISVDSTALDHQWFDSKRLGYFEITGQLIAHFSGGSSLILDSKKGADSQPIDIKLNNGAFWKVDEINGIAYSSNNERIDGRIEFQSQLSSKLLEDIFQRGMCDLPSFEESAALHGIFLDAMLAHWNHSQNRNDTLVPIT